MRRFRHSYSFAIGIVSVRFNAEPDSSGIAFALAHDIFAEPSRQANTQDQNPGCHRVKRSGVPDALHADPTPNYVDHVMTGHALWLIHDQEAERFHLPLSPIAISPISRTSAYRFWQLLSAAAQSALRLLSGNPQSSRPPPADVRRRQAPSPPMQHRNLARRAYSALPRYVPFRGRYRRHKRRQLAGSGLTSHHLWCRCRFYQTLCEL